MVPKELQKMEQEAVAEVAAAMLEDVRGFDFANAPESDIVEFLGYAYAEICERVATICEKDIPF